MPIKLLIFNVKFKTNTEKPTLQSKPPSGIEEQKQVNIQRKSAAYNINALKNIM